MKKPLLALAALLLACAVPADAQEISPARMAAAEDLLEAARMQQVMETSMEAMLQMQMENQPELRELEPVMRGFFATHVSWEQTKGAYARLYAERFTEAELREIAAFYRTPVGRKLAEVTPDLTVEGGRLGERLVQENLPELQRMIMEHLTGGTGG
jgi:uncharacterized protein